MLKKEISSFLGVGLIGAVVDFGLFNFLLTLSWQPIWASVLSVTVAGIVVFLGNLFISFRHVSVSSKLVAAGKFFLLALATIATNNLLVSLWLNGLDAPSLADMNLIKAAVVAALVVLRFAIMKFFIYVS